MGNIEFKDNKVVVFEKGKTVYIGKDKEGTTHIDLMAEYVNMKLNSDEYKDHPLLSRLRNSGVATSMAAQVLFLTNAVIFLNLGWSTFVMFKDSATNEDLQVIKDNADKIDALGETYLFKIGVVKDENGPLLIEDEMLEDDRSLPLTVRIDDFLEKTHGRGR